ncbi:MAG TPA: acyl-CoA dehydrogenase family protein [bacterium]|nr:acyl-CoA dehydrogenase family protein [bacterium]
MSFELTEEQLMIQLMVRDFARKEVEPVAAENDKKKTFPKKIIAKMGELGLLGMMIPEEYGGSGVGAVAYVLAMQEIAAACASTAVTMSVTNLSGSPILEFGTEEQKRKYLVPLASGQKIGAFAITEPGTGSDASSVSTKAVKKGNKYILNGAKNFITNGSYADTFIVIARTSSEQKIRGLSAFIVERGMPGFEIGREEDKMGLRASSTVQLAFDDCEVPAENLLGMEGEGFKIAMTALDSGRIGISSQAVGIARAALHEAIEYAATRKQFGRALSRNQAIQWMIADAERDIEAAHLLALSAASSKDRKLPFTREASIAKLFASEAAVRITYDSLQIHGGYGYTKEYKIERLYRDARVTTIYEGTSEVQRIVIAKHALV